ncbi:hypothetical protein Taro_010354 [Colocasia esculenta]|uniref:Uncharacterized protein n=1 Tax=Colocasia esculenta TaxID=4460 RepID=A0A843U817_COLES|nr:hypothetical protein [Colocasia esculenta]
MLSLGRTPRVSCIGDLARPPERSDSSLTMIRPSSVDIFVTASEQSTIEATDALRSGVLTSSRQQRLKILPYLLCFLGVLYDARHCPGRLLLLTSSALVGHLLFGRVILGLRLHLGRLALLLPLRLGERSRLCDHRLLGCLFHGTSSYHANRDRFGVVRHLLSAPTSSYLFGIWKKQKKSQNPCMWENETSSRRLTPGAAKLILHKLVFGQVPFSMVDPDRVQRLGGSSCPLDQEGGHVCLLRWLHRPNGEVPLWDVRPLSPPHEEKTSSPPLVVGQAGQKIDPHPVCMVLHVHDAHPRLRRTSQTEMASEDLRSRFNAPLLAYNAEDEDGPPGVRRQLNRRHLLAPEKLLRDLRHRQPETSFQQVQRKNEAPRPRGQVRLIFTHQDNIVLFANPESFSKTFETL